MNKAILSLASRLNASYLRDYNEYLDACDEWRKEGYRPHYCEHGTNQWTDYDNICGPCEDGHSMGDPLFRMRYALDMAIDRDERCRALVQAASTLRDLMPNRRWEVPAEVWDEVTRLLTVE